MLNIRQSARGKCKGLLLLPFIFSFSFPFLSLNHNSHQLAIGFPLGFAGSRYETFPSAPLGSAYPYDEQVGVTFTQDFSVLAFNVTAVPSTDTSGVGPGYLVNGLTNFGYWYQVGLSYNWPLTSGGVNYGFNMNYEVFDPYDNSIDPTNGGGLQSFNGPVNAGDIVLLSLSFSFAHVVMHAMDWQTHAVSSHSYTAYGSIFIGLRSSLAQSGFFTGLMTEQYHRNQYYGTGLPTTYNETGTSLTSAWMWIDEWNTDTGQSVFRDNTTKVQLDSSLSQYFSSNGTAEIANAHGLVTGLTPVTFPTLVASSQATGRPGGQASVTMVIGDPEGATVRFENLTITTSFGRYDFSVATPFSFSSGTARYNATINLAADLGLGSYNLTINAWSWQYLDTQAQEWIPLKQVRLNETLVVTNNPAQPPSPPNNPGPSPPSSGQGPSTSTNKTTRSPGLLLAILRSIVIPVAAGYAALGLLAFVLLIRQERKRSTCGRILGPRFCQSCGTELSPELLTCPSCGLSTEGTTSPENQAVSPNPPYTGGEAP
jgi:hypothetical protein